MSRHYKLIRFEYPLTGLKLDTNNEVDHSLKGPRKQTKACELKLGFAGVLGLQAKRCEEDHAKNR